MDADTTPGWHFTDDQGTFELSDPQRNNYLYFPLVNPSGMMSSVTPTLNGDAKLNQNTFLLLPVSVEDLHNTRSARNFWVRINGEPWSVTGNSAAQISQSGSEDEEAVILQAGFLWHEVRRQHRESGLSASVMNFVPSNGDSVELMRVTMSNHGNQPLEVVPTAAVPIFGRSADNLRDHRHVTALLHRTSCSKYGVLVKPTMSFDERGHEENDVTYAVLGADGEGNPPEGFTPLVEDFIGEGGTLDWPEGVRQTPEEYQKEGCYFEGYESIGALHFPIVRLEPGESKHYILILGILTGDDQIDDLVGRYGSAERFSQTLSASQAYWTDRLSTLQFDFRDDRRDGWLRWVTLQPILRRNMGNSFLPYHDYGRGGRGWRDLWQDLLAIIITEQTPVNGLLLGNFAGVRMDGGNATIVGTQPGEFKADRNSIPRVWMDHGAWPLLTTKLYLDWTGDLDLLLQPQTYFRDHLTHRCQQVDHSWKPEDGTILRTRSGEIVAGSVFEHLLVQHLTAFYNVGEHNIIRLEGGDWNDGLDMAVERGESAAFSAMYAGNLQELGDLCTALEDAGVHELEIAEELLPLLDKVSDPLDYASIDAKQERLGSYFDSVAGDISGKKVRIPAAEIRADLHAKAGWLSAQLRRQEWITGGDDLGWFNGYYDNQGQRVEGLHPQGIRMTLTGQVFSLMAGIPTPSQAQQVVRAVDHYLYDPALHGYRLNTDFGSDVPELGRAFAFAYGHKENGAVFSHMAVMYAYALFLQGLAQEAWKVLNGLYVQSQDFPISRIYPGIPEYFNPRGRGMYPYLTGSAAWYIFTLLTESFGIKGRLGDLVLEPKLTSGQFRNADRVKVETIFAGKKLEVIYRNPAKGSYGEYRISGVTVNGDRWDAGDNPRSIQFSREQVLSWHDDVQLVIDLE